MPRGKNCRETIFAARLPRNYPHRGGNFERGNCPRLGGRRNLGGILRGNLGEGNCESKIAARQWGVKFCREHQDASQGPLGGLFGLFSELFGGAGFRGSQTVGPNSSRETFLTLFGVSGFCAL